MPDMERMTRDLELHLAEDPIERARIKGRHQGEDRARWQIVIICAFAVLMAVLVCAALV